MKKITILGALTLLVIVSAFKLNNAWTVVDDKVLISFELPGEGTKGTISGLKATIDFDKSDLSTAKIFASVDVKTLNTGTAKKDDHLKTADFFDAEKYPTIIFVTTSIKAADKGFIAVGDLRIKDKSNHLEIPFDFTDDGKGNTAFTGTTSILCGDYGIMKKSDSGKDKVVITISVPVKK